MDMHLHAQSALPNPDEQLAAQYYQNKEYDKALVYYEKLYGKKNNPQYYHFYLTCLIETKDFRQAEKLVRRQLKQKPEALYYYIDLGKVFLADSKPEKAKEEYDKAIKSLEPNPNQVLDLAKGFMAAKQWDYAISTYIKGRKLLGPSYPFNFELAEAYGEKQDYISMANEYLDLLEISDGYIQSVQNVLQTNFGYEAKTEKNDILKTQLIRRIQNDPEKTIFSELLIWMLVQQKDFDLALNQAKALDKRNKEDGSRIMALGQLCVANEQYDIAAKAFQYVLAKGRNSYYYVNAQLELLHSQYQKLVHSPTAAQTDWLELDKNYTTSIAELGKAPATVPLLKSLAHIKAFYLHNTNDAQTLLEECVDMPGTTENMKAECKLELADILLMTGNIWDAALTYGQVEKAFKHDPIGQEAKFRNAKISYYTGDFGWAQTQLDVLKGSTSKLISNDAMNLSILISDNIGLDSNEVPLLMYARGELLIFQNRIPEAFLTFDSITNSFPSHALADEILWLKAKIQMQAGKFNQADSLLEQITLGFSADILADDALFMRATLQEQHFQHKQKAMELYQELLTQYPGSLYTVEARKRFRSLRGDVIQ